MKTLIALYLIITMAQTSVAQPSPSFEHVMKNYAYCLENEVDEIVFTAMIQLIRLKATHQDAPMEMVQGNLMRLTQHHNEELAYFAFVAMRITADKDLIKHFEGVDQQKAEQTFRNVAQELSQRSIAVR